MQPIDENILLPDAPLLDAMRQLNDVRHKILFVVDEGRRLLGTLTDGDIRRALLRSPPLDAPVGSAMNPHPIVAHTPEDRIRLRGRLREALIRYLPAVGADGVLLGLYDVHGDVETAPLPNRVILMAGGLGSRLGPLTHNCPKPMLEVGGKPILETILQSCIDQGLSRFYISLNYMGDMIADHFGDGSRWGVEIEYLRETERSGTAGALSLLPARPTEPFLLMNGDILTQVDFRNLLSFHQEHSAAVTMCVREYDMQVPYGTVEVKDVYAVALQEKPVFSFFVNAGIYCLDPQVMNHVTPGWLDMPDLINRLMRQQHKIASFPIHEYWIDIGRLDDFERAKQDFGARFAKDTP